MYDDNTTDARRIESVAKLHNPATAAEYDRIRRVVPEDRISPAQRLAMGYSDGAREAAAHINTDTDT
ncbi:hypothetical protein, partial [Pseudarthrobacter oxydans]|uniref:hypothetical protein n=1 Tax=Pseudarthrobacter oxydans TaxID=1671 RepID=UPI00344C4227